MIIQLGEMSKVSLRKQRLSISFSGVNFWGKIRSLLMAKCYKTNIKNPVVKLGAEGQLCLMARVY